MDALIRSLQDAALYAHPVKGFSVIETHISWVILTGYFAYKIKKPVNLGFVDFSTLDKRQHYCAEELRLNRRFAPNLYLEVVTITGTRTQPGLAGHGQAIEYAVRMREFSQQCLLSVYADEHRLEAAHMDAMAHVIAGFHVIASRAGADSSFGSSDTFLKWSRENFEHIETILPEHIFPDGYEAFKAWCLSPVDLFQTAINQRKADGFVRECHGDLHLGNMAIIDDRITPFDCIEFNEELRWIDTMNEIAFVAMDLQARGYMEYSWRFINCYLQVTGDYAGIALLRYYFVYRALVRAKVEALQAQQDSPDNSQSSVQYQAACRYLNLARDESENSRPALIVMHGLSGSGKSTVARQLVEHLGAIQVRSDIERKRLYGLEQEDASGSAPMQGIYTPDATRKTYDRLAELATLILQAGYAAVIDASFLELSNRDRFRALARACKVPFIIISCEASGVVLRDRIACRSSKETDPSEATLEVLLHQEQTHEPLTDAERGNSLVLVALETRLTSGQMDRLEKGITAGGSSQPSSD